MPGAQQIEEIQPALRGARAEPGEPVIADLRAKPVLAGMARTGIVRRHIGRGLQPGPQNRLCFADELVLFVGQQALHLSLRDGHAHRLQQRHQPGQCRLPLMIVHQHEATEFGTEMAIDPAGNGARMVRPSGVTQRSRR